MALHCHLLAYEARSSTSEGSISTVIGSRRSRCTPRTSPVIKKASGRNQQRAVVALKEWIRANPDATHISSIDMTGVLKAQGLPRNRRPEVLIYLVNIRVLTASVGGYAIDKAML